MIIVVLGFDVQTGDVVTGPDIISRGFAPLNRDAKLFDESLKVVLDSLAGSRFKTRGDWGLIKADIRADLRRFFRKRTDSRPMILPIIMEV
jgi:ribonuclease J